MMTFLVCFIATAFTNKPTEDKIYYFSKIEMIEILKDLHKAKEEGVIKQDMYNDFRKTYNQLAHQQNGPLLEISAKIVGKYGIFDGDKIKDKYPELQNKLQETETMAFSLISTIGETLDSARNEEKYAIRRTEISTAIILTTAAIAALVERTLKKRACVKAANFYELNRWSSMEEIIDGKPGELEWGLLLGNTCANAIHADRSGEKLTLREIIEKALQSRKE